MTIHNVPLPFDIEPAEANAVGSPTGRIAREAPETSVRAALTVKAGSHREIIAAALVRADNGLTSIEAAALLPLTAQHTPQVSNRSASRLGELWEEGRATILRQRGACVLGECWLHEKPQYVHRPTAPCDRHGKPLSRGGASIWVAVSGG
jgi:hypothetical protein